MPRRVTKQPSTQNLAEHKATSATATCLFCQQPGDDENPAIGAIYTKDDISAHKNCLYFGAGLAQSADGITEESEGADQLFFFATKAIMKEAKRSQKLKCSFCKLGFASAGCLEKRCKKQFHYPCGLKNGVQFNFRDFTTACADHRESQEPHSGVPVDLICNICHDDIEGVNTPDGCCGVPSTTQIYCPVCKRWLHRECVQQWAYKAGFHHLRCPMCNAGEEFRDELVRLGFELPDRDAEWELEGMYREQEQGTFLKCAAEECLCPHGRDYSARRGMQELIGCVVCGEFAIHRQCIDDYSLELSQGSVDRWWCELCEGVELKLLAQSQVSELFRNSREKHPPVTVEKRPASSNESDAQPNKRPRMSTASSEENRSPPVICLDQPGSSQFEQHTSSSSSKWFPMFLQSSKSSSQHSNKTSSVLPIPVPVQSMIID